jgi:hypothetical protein
MTEQSSLPTASSLSVLTAETTAHPMTASSIIPHMMTQEFTLGSMNLLKGRVALLEKTYVYTNLNYCRSSVGNDNE